ncbi:ABC transporter ATP-binding protein [Oculatella sp. FACHB-28]|uniref:ABC transporter ATP-binding protein n=1 Tax=Oculatella sp. FACHB-28 TaxID=2692845 RepID=UPI0018EF9ADE|nr:ABC transporter ATP-binding protein [Oculatella sp. FACHB-28]
MNEIAISLENISKCFKRYAKPVDRLKEILLPQKNHAQIFWALQDINLNVTRGEALGIIGQNGSGKSTLLQIIAKTLTPTTGEVFVNGRVSALLELGSGFNPEFTGRQNVFFNGQILGLSQQEIATKLDEIIKFAEIGDFIEQPVKTYSSGMFVRLAFAVAVSVNPDILIVDEALAVGDIYFQQKCFERIQELKKLGTTLLFVSHDSTAVYKLCNRAILIESGKAVLDASPKQVIDLYEAKLLKRRDTHSESVEIQIVAKPDSPDQETSSSDQVLEEVIIQSSEVSVKFVQLLDENGQVVDSVISEQALQLSIGLLFLQGFDDLHIGFKVRDRTGEVIFETNTFAMREKIGKVYNGTFLEVIFRFHVPLREGEYTISLGVADGGFGEGLFKRSLVYAHNSAAFNVLRNNKSIHWSGIVNLNPSISINSSVYV